MIKRAINRFHLVGESVHDDTIGHETKRMHLTHQNIGWDLVELNILQKIANYFFELRIGVRVTILLTPHKCRLENIEYRKHGISINTILKA
jgi:hypothetical protein